MPDKHSKQIALLIDADNALAQYIQKVLAELAKYGKVHIRRAYGDWTSGHLKKWEVILPDHAIQPMQQYALTKTKNATDIAMAIDAMDILYANKMDMFCIMSSDCDFTPLVTRIRAEGKSVIGFGERKTPPAFVNACVTFLFLDKEVQKESKNSLDKEPEKVPDNPSDKTSEKALKQPKTKVGTKELRGDDGLMNLLRGAISSCEDENGWANLGAVGSHISNHASFDSRNYGYPRLSDLIKVIGPFEMRRNGSNQFEVRDAQRHSS